MTELVPEPGARAVAPPVPAPAWRRFVAALVEVVVAWMALAIVVLVLMPADPDTWTSEEEETGGLIVLAFLTVWFNYLVLSESRWGRTFGKLVLDLRVVGEDGRRVSWNRSLVRNLLRLPDLVLAPLLIPLSDRRQRLGDRAAHTIVVMDEPSTPSPAPGEGPAPAAPETSLGPRGADVEPPPPAAPAPGWGAKRVIGGLAALLALVLVEAVVVSAIDGGDSDSLGLAASLTLQASLAATMVAVAFAVARPGSGWALPAELGLRRPLHPAIKASVIAYFAYLGCAIVIAAVLQPEQEDVTRELGADEGVLGSIVAGVLIVCVAPVSEEIFFRGFMFNGLRRGTSFVVAALVSAGIWGVFHYTGPETWGVVLQLTVFGVALAWLYERTGSLYPTIAVHGFNNAVAFAILMS
jgi:membrane protease YdiL (CAAX protease family)/uncharacterized RDD family membrane protein YckC